MLDVNLLADKKYAPATASPLKYGRTSDLPNEILLVIGRFIGHPPHVLNFSLVNRRLHQLSDSFLYTRISLDSTRYRHTALIVRQCGQVKPYPVIVRLGNKLAANPEPGPRIRYLEVRVVSNTNVDGFGLSKLLPLMSSLDELHITVDKFARKCFQIATSSSPLALTIALDYVNATLKTFSFFTDVPGLSTIGSLNSFLALKSLDIQHTHFLNWYDRLDPTPLSPFLPRKLKELKIRCYPGYSLAELLHEFPTKQVGKRNSWTTAALSEILEQAPRSMRELRKLCFCFDKLWETSLDSSPQEMYALLKAKLPGITKVAQQHGTEVSFEVVRDATLQSPTGSLLQSRRCMRIA